MARQTDEPVEEEAPKGCAENCAAFMRFLYNSQEGTVLGRGGKSWFRISVFYLFYYIFLAGLFIASITICFHCLDEYKPYYQNRLENPGVTIQPKLHPSKSLEKDIIYDVTDAASYEKYTTQLEEFLEPYNSTWQSGDDWKNCDFSRPNVNPDFDSDQTTASCKFDAAKKLGACGTGDFGYGDGQPCVLVKLNRVINWMPLGYDENEDEYSEAGEFSKAPPLSEVLEGKTMRNHLLYVSCYGMKEEDRMNLNGETAQVSANTKYSPEGLPFGFYPYHGKKHQPNYLSPVVGVQFTKVTKNVLISVGCKVYARNIDEDEKLESGYFNFKLQINDGESESD